MAAAAVTEPVISKTGYAKTIESYMDSSVHDKTTLGYHEMANAIRALSMDAI